MGRHKIMWYRTSVTRVDPSGQINMDFPNIKPKPFDLKNIQFDEAVLVRRLRETAYLNGGLKIYYKNEHTGTKEEFFFEGGIADYVSYLASSRTGVFPSKPFFFDNKSGKINVQVAFQYGDEDEEKMGHYVGARGHA